MHALQALATWPVDHAAGAVVLREPGTGPPVVAASVGEERVGEWASVTKLCTALAVLVAHEERTVSLDDDLGPPGASVAHLLAHASGLGPDRYEVLTQPGRRRIYSNVGFELLAAHLAERADMAFERYLDEAVLGPLGMAGARLAPGASAAAGMTGTIHDLVQLARELLAPTVVHPGTFRRATAVAFPGLAGILPGFGAEDPCDWGLGFEIRDHKAPHWTGTANDPATFGHFGRSGSFLWVDPAVGVACAVQTDRTFGPWAATAWPALADDVLAEVAELRRADG